MTIRQIAQLLLRDLGVTTFATASQVNALNRRGVGTTDLEAVCSAINGALDEIWNDGPTLISERPFGEVLRAPTPLTLDVTEYGATVANVTTWADWMLGCTVRINGDGFDNRFVSSTELARPFLGSTTAGATATVYADAVTLPDDYSHIIEPIRIPGLAHMGMVNTALEFEAYSGLATVVTPRTTPVSYSSIINKVIGQPTVGFIDTMYNPTGDHLQVFLRFAPMPGQAYPLSFLVKTKPPKIEPENIETGDGETDPNVILPVDWPESVLYPIARQRLTGDSLFGNEAGKPEILRQFKVARAILDNQAPNLTRHMGVYK